MSDLVTFDVRRFEMVGFLNLVAFLGGAILAIVGFTHHPHVMWMIWTGTILFILSLIVFIARNGGGDDSDGGGGWIDFISDIFDW